MEIKGRLDMVVVTYREYTFLMENGHRVYVKLCCDPHKFYDYLRRDDLQSRFAIASTHYSIEYDREFTNTYINECINFNINVDNPKKTLSSAKHIVNKYANNCGKIMKLIDEKCYVLDILFDYYKLFTRLVSPESKAKYHTKDSHGWQYTFDLMNKDATFDVTLNRDKVFEKYDAIYIQHRW